MHLVKTSCTPAASSTARTGPPAITPVPGAAGLSRTRPAPSCPSTSCGMVRPIMGTLNRFLRARSLPLRIASGTSFALPKPIPTLPSSSPTTTRAEKLKRRPPLTTLATRLMWMTRSRRLSSSKLSIAITFRLSEVQASFACRFGQCLDTTVVEIAIAIEDHAVNRVLLANLSDECAHLFCRSGLVGLFKCALEIGRQRRRCRQGLAGTVIHHLSVNMLSAAEYGQTGTLSRTGDFVSDAELAALPPCQLHSHNVCLTENAASQPRAVTYDRPSCQPCGGCFHRDDECPCHRRAQGDAG